jgi:DNA-binding transcriptional MocR family regulator
LTPAAALERLFSAFIAHQIILTPCSVFRTNDGNPLRSDEVRFRASFSFTSEGDMEEGVRRMAAALEEVFAEATPAAVE